MEIKARCKFDLNSMKALTHLSLFKKADPKRRMIFWSVLYIVLAAIMILEIVLLDAGKDLAFPLFALIVAWCLVFFLYAFMPKIRYNALANMKEAENEYIFCDNALKAYTKSQAYNGEAEVQYSLFVKVFETSRYFFLFQTKNQVFIVDKSTIEGGTAENIRNKLAPYIKGKYIICKY